MDGVFLKDDPLKLMLEGVVADIPFVVGESPDILFEIGDLNIVCCRNVQG